MEYMEGGAIPVREDERFRLVFDMINQDNSEIKCVSYSSLNGFIFSVGGKGVEPSFKSVTKGEGKDYQTGLKKILMKLVVISDPKEKLDNIKVSGDGKLLNLNDTVIGDEFEEVGEKKENKSIIKTKRTITENEFKEETVTQIDVFKKTWQFGNLPLCPSVLSYAVIDNVRSLIFINMLLDKVGNNKGLEKPILKYLKKQLGKSGRSIGILCMEYKESFQTYAEYADTNSHSPEKMKTDSYYILAKMIILLLECGIVHCDLHMNNILIKPKCSELQGKPQALNKICYEMIDFGRIKGADAGITINKERIAKNAVSSKLTTGKTRGQTNKAENNTATQQKDEKSIDYDHLTPEQILSLLQLIYDTDLKYKKKINPKLQFPQCAWIFGKADLLDSNRLKTDQEIVKSQLEKIKEIMIKYYDNTWTEITESDPDQVPNETRKTFDQIFEMRMYKDTIFTSIESEIGNTFTFYGMMLIYYLQKFGEGYKVEQIIPSEENGPINVEISRYENGEGVVGVGDEAIVKSRIDNLNHIIRAMDGTIHFSFVGKSVNKGDGVSGTDDTVAKEGV